MQGPKLAGFYYSHAVQGPKLAGFYYSHARQGQNGIVGGRWSAVLPVNIHR